MKCDDAINLVVDSLMDRLEPDEQSELDEHLASCAECAAEATALRQMWRDVAEVETPPSGKETLIRFGQEMERTRKRPAWSAGLKAAAVVGLLLGGGVLGRITGREPAVSPPLVGPSQSYLLVIRGDEPDRRFPDQQLTEEYRAWAGALANEGILVAAEKLKHDNGRWVSDLAPAEDNPRALALMGYFLIQAESYEEAVSVARESPHIAYGGTIEVREIERE